MTIGDQLAGLARSEIERHDEWDSMHHLMLICRTGEDSIAIRTFVVIDPGIDPSQYPAMIENLVERSAADGEPAYALLLQIEAYGATLSVEEYARHAAGTGSLKDRPGREEAAWAWVTDVHGGLWSAMKVRGKGDVIKEEAYAPGSKSHSGRFIKAMRDALLMHGSEYPVTLKGKESE